MIEQFFTNLNLINNALKTFSLVPSKIVNSEQGGIAYMFITTNVYADIECLFSGEILAIVKSDTRNDIWQINVNYLSHDLQSIKKFIKENKEND